MALFALPRGAAAGLPLTYTQFVADVGAGTSASPAATGLTGKLTAVTDIHGDQVAYNGHLLYTFADDQPGQVTGQGVQGFFVATPGLTALTGSPAPAAPAGNPYGY